MFTAADLIDVMAARARRRHPLQLDRPFGEFPPTWRAWFQAIAPNPDGVRGAHPDDLVAVMAARPLRARPRRTPVLTRWVAFRQLWRQQWDPAEPSQRRLRRWAAATSGVLHVCFMLLLLYVGYVELGNAPPRAAVQGEAIRVEFIGRGTPVEQGGAPSEGDLRGAPSAAAPGASSRAAAAPDAAVAAAAPSDPVSPAPAEDATLASPPPPTATAPEPSPQPQPPTPAPPAASQPVQLTQADDEEVEFRLPPVTPRDPAMPTLPTPREVPTLATRDIELVERPVVRVREARMPDLPRPAEPAPLGPLREIEIVERTVPQVRTRDVPMPTVPVKAPEALRPRGEIVLRDPRPAAAPAPSAPQRPVGTPTPSPAQGDARTPSATTTGQAGAGTAPRGASGNAASGNAQGTTPAATGRSASAPPAPTSGGRPAGSGSAPQGRAPSGVGMGPSPRPGALPSPTRGDDWGASNQNRPGNAPTGGRTGNLFNPDGSIRMPGNSGDVGGGLPPGTLIEDFEKIDRMGTWLKRPPLDYTPTRFDRFWIPNESLLEEWVRRGVKTVAVPLPGTSKRLRCVVSLLQAGGGCSIDDPNLRDEEATARPPPDVPYKPELQER